MIKTSCDGTADNVMKGTLAAGIAHVGRTWPNALRMLENS